MEKKLRVTLPKYMNDIVESDCEEFHIKKNTLLNFIFEFLKEETFYEEESCMGEKIVLQFNLNKSNREIYYSFLLEKGIQNESEFFRKLIGKYANKPKMKRENFIFQESVKKLIFAIKENLVIHISFQDGKKTQVEPYHMGTSNLEIANYLFCFDLTENSFKNYRLCNIDSVYITRKNFIFRDKTFIENVKKDFDPFLSQGKTIKVFLTEKGEKIFRELKVNRPKVLNKKNGIYEFQCSEEKAKRYFSYFLDEAEILEPLHLREWFLKKFSNALILYKTQI
ncbi:MAG: WYL domain-containing protein [Fusobacteriaceae bacterium]